MEHNKIYHEKQKYFFCAKHTLNNLFQDKIFSSKQLDSFCEELTKTKFFYNPHRNFFKLGNYDINVIEKALNSLGQTIQWFDMRKNVNEVNILNDKDIFGLILNVQYQNTMDKIMGCNTHHWLAIKVINGEIVNLDSKRDNYFIMKETYFYEYLTEVQKGNGQILIVRKIGYDKQQEEEIKVDNDGEDKQQNEGREEMNRLEKI